MFEAFFEMKQAPFVSSIDTDALYMSPMLDEALSRLNYAAKEQLFAIVTADVGGCGKSTTIRRFASTLVRKIMKYCIYQIPSLHPGGFTKAFWNN